MATNASSAPSPSPSPASYSVISADDSSKVKGSQQNGIFHNNDRKPDFADRFDDLGSKDYHEKFRKYEAEYGSRLMAKYFSRKTIHGGDVFDENVIIKDEIIKSSRWPCMGSYADPVTSFEVQSSEESALAADAFTSISSGKQIVQSNR